MNVPLNIDWQQILLHLFNLVILFAIMYFLLYKPVKDFMEKRQKFYKDMDDEAKNNLKESEKIKSDYEAKMSTADEEIATKKSEALEEAAKNRKEIVDNAKAESDEIVAAAKKKAKEEHDRILGEAQKEIADMVSVATSKIVGGEELSDSFDSFLNANGK